jgi:quinol monooxygenase YgiN
VSDTPASGPQARLLPDRHGLVVRLEAHPGGRPAVLDALHRYADLLDQEPATELFVISLDPDDAEVVWLHEWFHEEAGLDAHRAAPAFAALMSELSTSLANPPGVMRFQPLRMHLAEQLLSDDTMA